MKILMTGASGSVGSRLLMQLNANKAGEEVFLYEHDARKKDISAFGSKKDFDAVVICHGGHKSEVAELFESNAISIARDLRDYAKVLKKDGCIIVLSSRRGILPTVKEWNYSAAKAALRAYCIALYKDRPDLRITCLCPGWLESNQAKAAKIKSVISMRDLADAILSIIRCKTMRIPEIVIEPIGDAQYG